MKSNSKCVRIFADKHLENIRSMFKTLYEDEILTDCTLICKGGAVKAHKIILASCSSYFRKIFSDYVSDNTIFIMYGVTFVQLKVLIALIYKGCIDIPNENLTSIFDLAEELDISGILVEGKDTNYSQHATDQKPKQKIQPGQKRSSLPNLVENGIPASKIAKTSTENIRPVNQLPTISEPTPIPQDENAKKITNQVDSDSMEPLSETSSSDQYLGHAVDEQTSLSAWARQERKFQCDQCSSSFKRASHLSRHQLVHTGERPFPCGQCDKAFSRHDKLKNHIQKTHELELLNDALPPDSLYTIGHVQILTPEQTMIEMSGTVNTNPDVEYKPYLSAEDEDDEDDDVPTPESSDFKPPMRRKHRGRPKKVPIIENSIPKRPRGRPRKFPIIDPSPQMKRPRGRPRIRPLVPKIKRPVGRPRIRPIVSDFNEDVKNVKRLPQEVPTNSTTITKIIEPLVQIKSEPNTGEEPIIEESIEPSEPDVHFLQNASEPEVQIIEESGNIPVMPIVQTKVNQDLTEKPIKTEHRSFFENIGLFENSNTVAKIGECTISVSNSTGSSTPIAKTVDID